MVDLHDLQEALRLFTEAASRFAAREPMYDHHLADLFGDGLPSPLALIGWDVLCDFPNSLTKRVIMPHTHSTSLGATLAEEMIDFRENRMAYHRNYTDEQVETAQALAEAYDGFVSEVAKTNPSGFGRFLEPLRPLETEIRRQKEADEYRRLRGRGESEGERNIEACGVQTVPSTYCRLLGLPDDGQALSVSQYRTFLESPFFARYFRGVCYASVGEEAFVSYRDLISSLLARLVELEAETRTE